MKKQSVRNAVIIVGALGVLGLSGCGDSVTKTSVAAGGVKEIAIKVAPGSSSPASVAGYEAVARATGFDGSADEWATEFPFLLTDLGATQASLELSMVLRLVLLLFPRS